MSTPIPGLASQVIATNETVQVTGGTLQSLPTTNYYYFVSNRASGNGASLLGEIGTLLNASLAATWTVELVKSGGLYKVQIAHNLGSPKTVTFSSTFAANLGFANASFSIPVGSFVVADYPSVWWWTPDMPISLTGPVQFDPAISYGIPDSAGASQRAPDMTTAYVQNGVQWSASYMFNGVEFYYKIRPQVGHTNEDLDTWWQAGPAQGRMCLWWRDRDTATLQAYPSRGSASPWKYIEYAPQETLRKSLPAVVMSGVAPERLTHWDVTFDLWLTTRGETPLTD